jgi:hypothetical protein
VTEDSASRPRGRRIWLPMFAWSGNAAVALAMGLALERAYSTDCGYSPAAMFLLIPSLLWLAVSLWMRRQGPAARMGILLALLGVGLSPYLEATNVLRPYDAWLHAGMPEPPEPEWAHRVAIMYGVAGVFLMAATEATIHRARSRRRKD